ncbi:MAG: hypothetical protein ABI616_10995 [Pseudomonadota bacterium]
MALFLVQCGVELPIFPQSEERAQAAYQPEDVFAAMPRMKTSVAWISPP